jgi:hypothetical protein
VAVFALLSAGGAPGVTTAALALTLSWPSQVILAECDPSGGDVLAGLLGGHLPASAGLLPLALEAGAGSEIPADKLWNQLVELDEEHNRLLLAGISDPRQSMALQSSLPWIADALQGMKADVIADCGRLDSVAAVRPVLSAASLAVLVLRPTLRQVSRAVPRIEMLTNMVGRDRVVLLLVGEGTASGREITKTLGVPVAGQLPGDAKTAAVLSDGAGSRNRLEGRPLIRAATAAGRGMRQAATAAGPLLGYGNQTVFSPYNSDPPGLDQYTAPQQEGLDQYGGGQHRLDQPWPDQPRLDQPRLDQPRLDEEGSGQHRLVQPRLDQPRLDEGGSGQHRLDQPRLDEGGSGQFGLDQSGLGHFGLSWPEGQGGLAPPETPDSPGGLGGLARLAGLEGTEPEGTHFGNAQNGSRP